MHLARGMGRRDVEGGEIVEIVLDIRPLGDGESHLAEDGDDLVDGLAHRMDAALGLRARRQSDVDPLLGEARVQRGPGEVRLARVQGGGDRLLQGVEALAGLAPLLGAEAAEGLHELGDLALLAQGLDPDALQILQRGCGLGRSQPLVPDLVQLLHDLPNPKKKRAD